MVRFLRSDWIILVAPESQQIRSGLPSNRVSGRMERLFDILDGNLAEVENRSRQNRVGPCLDGRREIGCTTGTATGDERKGDGLAHIGDHLKIEPLTGTIRIHGIEQNLACSQLLGPLNPINGIDARGPMPSHGGHFVS